MQFDVIVVGAGVEGSATAYQLIRNGAKNVLLLEQVLKLYASYIYFLYSACSSRMYTRHVQGLVSEWSYSIVASIQAAFQC